MSNWQPTPSDIEWTRKHFDGLNDNTRWGIPRNQSIYRLDKTNKVLTCIYGDQDYMFDNLTTVCKILGYTTVYAPEDMGPEEVAKHLAPVEAGADTFGTGKNLVVTDREQPKKRYSFREITPEDTKQYRINLAKLPREYRWKGRLSPQCDFCTDTKPIVTYAAHRMTSGQVVDCWRWLACAACHDAITRNDFKAVERRSAGALQRGAGKEAAFAVKMTLMAFHSDAIEE